MAVGKRRGKAHEARTATRTGGELVPFSGAGKIKGDVLTPLVFFECKSSAARASGDVKSIGLRKDWLIKMQLQAAKENKPLAALVVHFTGDRNDWVAMSMGQWEQMLEAWLAYQANG